MVERVDLVTSTLRDEIAVYFDLRLEEILYALTISDMEMYSDSDYVMVRVTQGNEALDDYLRRNEDWPTHYKFITEIMES